MGAEIAPWNEWNHESSLDWHLLKWESHEGVCRLIKDLNYLYQTEPALYQLDFSPQGFQWVDLHDADTSVISFLRKGKNKLETLLVVCNFTPIPRSEYLVGVPFEGSWAEIFNSDSHYYGGSNSGNLGEIQTEEDPTHLHAARLSLTLPPLSTLILKLQ